MTDNVCLWIKEILSLFILTETCHLCTTDQTVTATEAGVTAVCTIESVSGVVSLVTIATHCLIKCNQIYDPSEAFECRKRAMRHWNSKIPVTCHIILLRILRVNIHYITCVNITHSHFYQLLFSKEIIIMSSPRSWIGTASIFSTQ